MIGIDKWNQVLGELRYMSLALPVSQGLFIQMQEALKHVHGKRVILSNGVQQ